MKIALVHEYLTQYGGAERVLDSFLDLWPKAPIYTIVYLPEKMAEHYGKREIHTSFLQNWWAPPPAGFKWYLALHPRAIESFDFSDYDVVFSDSSAYAKGVITKKPTVHISYIHTPTRYLWTVQDEYVRDAPIPAIIRPFVSPVLASLRAWDFRAAQRPDYIIANSKNVAERIRQYYKREADAIIFPPVDIRRFKIVAKPDDYWLIVGRHEPYKRTDLVIQAANQLGINLVIVGGGSSLPKLKEMAGKTVTFPGRLSDEEVASLYAKAQGFIFAAEEDAGITPLESMAAGRPVLAYGKGGALETVVPGVTGEFFTDQTVSGIVQALSKFRAERYDPDKIRAHAATFDTKLFKAKIEAFIKEHHGTV